MTQKVRDGIRSAIFADQNKKAATRPLNLFGQDVEVHQPTLAQITRLSKASADEKIPAIVRIMIEYIYVPGTNEKVFDIGDAAMLAEMPSGKWLSDFNKVIEELSGVDVQAAEKNSEKTD